MVVGEVKVFIFMDDFLFVVHVDWNFAGMGILPLLLMN